MTDTLRKAAQACLDRWDSPAWEWSKQGPTAELFAELRRALAQADDAFCDSHCTWLDHHEQCRLSADRKDALDLYKAAQMALDALEYHTAQTRPIHSTSEAITALKAVINRQHTHSDNCWSWGPAHYDCALRKIGQYINKEK